MSENYIVINGKKAELTKEQLEKLGIKTYENKYEEMFNIKKGDQYYYIDCANDVLLDCDSIDPDDDFCVANANACKDADVMWQRSLHEILNRRLWRASMIAGELDNPWDGVHKHYSVCFDYSKEKIFIDVCCARYIKEVGVEYFPSEKTAKDAIRNIVEPFWKEHPDFVL